MATVVYGDFEWDDAKAEANVAKHGISFEEASMVFADPCYILLPDETHADNFLALGLSGLMPLLTVVHIERGPRIRIVSARKATILEAQVYERRRF